MYEELVKRLRNCATGDPTCNICDLITDDFCCETLMTQAADAIEVLICDIDLQKDENKALYNALPKWIPVTEKLPEKAYGCLVIVWDNNPYTGDVFLNYYPEFVGYDSGTWNDCDGEAIPLDVVYWMKMPKIPEPPKEN